MISRISKSLSEIEKSVPIGSKYNIVFGNELILSSVLTEVNSRGLIITRAKNPQQHIFSVDVPLLGTQFTFDTPREYEVGFRVLDNILNGRDIILSWDEVEEFKKWEKIADNPLLGKHN